MTPQEKWDRLNHPTCLSDYGLSISEDELVTFPEGARLVDAVKKLRREDEEINKMMGLMGAAAAVTVEKIYQRVIDDQ